MNVAAFAALTKADSVCYTGPISPPVSEWQKARSKLLRLTGLARDFVFFSTARLEAIAEEVLVLEKVDARLDFYHGFTPWILTTPRRPYIAWSDCTFHDYVEIFHSSETFRSADLQRIEAAEAAWLQKARRVLFTSDWAAERAMEHYGLDPNCVGTVGIFGEVEGPDRDVYAGGKEFAFVSTDFEAKGGRAVLAAFQEVRRRHSDAVLIIVGDRPAAAATEAGVTYAGFLRKEVQSEYSRFQEILGRARAVVNATRCDIAPLLLVEAGYFGCPAISSRRFAIPELVDDGRTGLLIDDSSRVEQIAGAMNWMLEHDDEYHQMRKAAWAKAHGHHPRRRFQERLLSHVREVMFGEGQPAA